jgi:hypothetical protein
MNKTYVNQKFNVQALTSISFCFIEKYKLIFKPKLHPLYRAFLEDCRIAFASLSEGLAGAIHDEDDMQIFANALSEERNLENKLKCFKRLNNIVCATMYRSRICHIGRTNV